MFKNNFDAVLDRLVSMREFGDHSEWEMASVVIDAWYAGDIDDDEKETLLDWI